MVLKVTGSLAIHIGPLDTTFKMRVSHRKINPGAVFFSSSYFAMVELVSLNLGISCKYLFNTNFTFFII